MVKRTVTKNIVFLSFLAILFATTSYCQVTTTLPSNQGNQDRIVYTMDEKKEQQNKKDKKNRWIVIVTGAVVTAVAGFVLMTMISDPH